MYFFYAFGTCVSPRRIFFTPWAPASCAGVFILRVCGNRTCTFTASVFSYPHIVHFFWKVHFWTAPVETKITFLLQVYSGSTCFPKVKRTFNCFKIVRVSTGFGEFNRTPLQEHARIVLYAEKLSTSNLPFISIYPFHEFAESVKRRCKCKAIAPWPDVSDVVTSHLVDPVSLHRCLSRQDIYIYYNFLQPTTSQIAPTFNQS